MGQAVADLPDPLESASPAEAQSADDLLSQLAGDEIDRLLAESEGAAPRPASAPVDSPPPQAPDVTGTVDLDAVLQTAAERSALHAIAHAPITDNPADHSPPIDLDDAARSVPLILRPLEWLSSPLDPWPDQLREVLGKVGLMTFINALAVIAYVMLVRRHHH